MDETQNRTTEEKEKVLNGVSVTKLFQTVGAIKANPDIADFNFRAKGNGSTVDIIGQL